MFAALDGAKERVKVEVEDFNFNFDQPIRSRSSAIEAASAAKEYIERNREPERPLTELETRAEAAAQYYAREAPRQSMAVQFAALQQLQRLAQHLPMPAEDNKMVSTLRLAAAQAAEGVQLLDEAKCHGELRYALGVFHTSKYNSELITSGKLG